MEKVTLELTVGEYKMVKRAIGVVIQAPVSSETKETYHGLLVNITCQGIDQGAYKRIGRELDAAERRLA